MLKLKIIVLLFTFPLFVMGFGSQFQNSEVAKQNPVKNIIFVIGDGMGISQVSAGIYSNSNKSFLEEFKTIGLHKSYSYDNLITDSAAAATAFSTGKKTNNGVLGLDANGMKAKTIVEEASEKGIKTGLIVSSTITHATPAAFYAHQESRKMNKEIARDLAHSDIDLFIGGGKEYFMSKEDSLLSIMEKNGFKIIQDYTGAIDESIDFNHKKIGIFTDAGSPAKVTEGRTYLASAVTKGIEFLNNKQEGFFLMIESSQIDWAGHDQDQTYLIGELREFETILGTVLEFAKKDKNTLVIVTGDHETGGMAIDYGSTFNDVKCIFSSGGHTGDLIPVFAYGPGAESFGGIYENTDLFYKMKRVLGL